ncbi:MAG: UDP-N-acetylmuramoyl-L-alanine--D-glutamate ligase [Desulfatirhabdiaceae bacterium]
MNRTDGMNFLNKNILVVGLGLTGVALTRFLRHQGARVTATDMALAPAKADVIRELQAAGVVFELGGHRPDSFIGTDMIVISPGVPHTLPELESARVRGIPVMGEIELAFRFVNAPIIAVTGTNGKTTATTLLGDMLSESGFRVFVGGNIGSPLIGYVDRNEKVDRIVLEISSFQLDTIDTFRPHVAVLLNTTEDHLDRYPDMAAYAASKCRIFLNQKQTDIAITNACDTWAESRMNRVVSQKFRFNTDGPGNAQIHDTHIRWRIDACHRALFLPEPEGMSVRKSEFQLDLTHAKIRGRHNMENICAAFMAALAAGGTLSGIQAAVNRFAGLPHRMTHIRTVNGVSYINDSKATNVDAVIRALECFDKPVILIMGGRDKDSPFPSLRTPVSQHARHVILLGEARYAIQNVLKPDMPVTLVDSMADAVQTASRLACPGDVVLLSPACASFDMFTSYGHRGNVFREAVEAL